MPRKIASLKQPCWFLITPTIFFMRIIAPLLSNASSSSPANKPTWHATEPSKSGDNHAKLQFKISRKIQER